MVSKSPKKLEMDKVKELFMSRLEVKEQEEEAKVEEEKKKEQEEKKTEVAKIPEVEKKTSPPRAPPAPPQNPPQSQAKEEPTTSDGMLRDEIMGTVLLFLRDTLSIFILHYVSDMDKTDLLVQVQKLQLMLDLEKQKTRRPSVPPTPTVKTLFKANIYLKKHRKFAKHRCPTRLPLPR